MKTQNIPTAVYYPKCLHEQLVFEPLGYKYGAFPESEKASRVVISLPMWVYRVLMFAWALWIALALSRWLKNAWSAWTSGGMWRGGLTP